MSTSVEGVTGASLYYHTDTYSCAHMAPVSIAAAIGVGLLVFGVVAHLKSLPGLPPAALYASMGTGGVLVLASALGIVILEVKRRKKLEEVYGNFLKGPTDAAWCKMKMDAIEPTQNKPKRVAFEAGNHNDKVLEIYFINTSDKFNNRQIHVFELGEESNKFLDNLIENCDFTL